MKNLDKKNIENILGLTPTQEGMLFHYLKDPDGAQYYEQLCLNVSGKMDIRRFEKAWNIVIETNEMLRTVFRWEKLEKPAQIILKEHKCELHVYDLTDKNNSQKRAALEEIKAKDRQKNFDLNRVPFRVILCKIAENKYLLIISNHHILYNGWSTGIIIREFFNVYHALSSGNQQVKPPAKHSFKEFIQWMRNQDKTKQKQFWTGYLAGFEVPTRLPIKIKRKKAREIKGFGNYKVILKRSIKDQLEIFIKEHRVTLAAFFYSTWGILLQRYCNTEDVIFGTTVSGISAPIKGIQDMIGLFINTLPLRINTGIGEKVKDLLNQVNHTLSIREEYENTPLVDIKEYSQLENNAELFNSFIAMENYPLDRNLMDKNSHLPDHTALVGVEETRNLALLPTPISITYRELNEKSHRLALLLREKGVKPDSIVSIMIERYVDMIIGILGILKTGDAYLPIDPNYPEEKINYILDDSKVNILFKKDNNFKNFSPGRSIDAISRSNISLHSSSHLHLPLAPVTSLAYILYTSGYTGRPKGVMVGHLSVINVLLALQKKYPLLESDVYLLKTSITFDVSAAELFGWFFNGRRLALLERGEEKDPEMILNTIAYNRITHSNFVPSMFNAFLNILNPAIPGISTGYPRCDTFF